MDKLSLLENTTQTQVGDLLWNQVQKPMQNEIVTQADIKVRCIAWERVEGPSIMESNRDAVWNTIDKKIKML